MILNMSPNQLKYLKKIKREKILITTIQLSLLIGFIVIWEILSKYNIINSFISRKFPLQGKLMSISALGRYDYMGEHSDGKKNEEGMLTVTQPERHRMTLGSTLTFGTVRRIELRVNYEKYFYHKDAVIPVSDHDKLVVEVMCRF